MKKILAMLIAAVMLLALAGLPAVASSSNIPYFYLEGPSTAKAGDTITVKLFVSGEYQAHTLNMRVYFDNTSYRLEGKTFGDAYLEARALGGWGMCDLTQEQNAVSLGIMRMTSPMSAVGELLSMDFKVLGTASSNTDFSVTVEDFGYMPIGQTVADPIGYSTSGLSVKVTGGSGGSSTTPNPIVTPKPGNTPGTNPGGNTAAPTQDNSSRMTPAPGTTEIPSPTQPNVTEKPDEPSLTESDDPVLSEEPASSELPDASGEPEESLQPEETGEAATDEPGSSEGAEPTDPAHTDPTRKHNATGWLIAGGAVVLAGAAAICAAAVKRSKKRKETK